MKYPIGIQTFEQIINEGYVYVDKTALVYSLANNGKIYFLSRPRRFGKSLLVSTLENYFLGNKELFKGLAIEELETEWKKYPIFHVDFNGDDFAEKGALKKRITSYIRDWESLYDITPYSEDSLGVRFANVLKTAYERTGLGCVVLVDEYDKPLLDVLDEDTLTGENEESLENQNRKTLKAFYSTFKLADKHLRFVFLTGVTKFSQVSVFSGFNQPKDISMVDKYDTICGITDEEIDVYFQDVVEEMALK